MWGTRLKDVAGEDPRYGFADFNGDARMDFIYRQKNTKTLRVMLSAGSGFGSDTVWGNYFRSYADPPNHAFADFNGDGKADFAYRRRNTKAWYIKLSNGTGFASERKWGSYKYAVGDDAPDYAFADFNGDGKTDFAYRRQNTSDLRVMISNGSSFENDTLWGRYNNLTSNEHPTHAFADFNGDGMTDFAYRKKGTSEWWLMVSNGSGFEGEEKWGTYHHNLSNDPPRFGFADFNGDGKLDFLYRQKSTKKLWVMLSNGEGFEDERLWGEFDLSSADSLPIEGYADFNGDGMADFAYRKRDTRQWQVKLSNGRGFEAETTWGICDHGTGQDRPNYLFADFTGDGKADFIYRPAYSSDWRMMESHKEPFALLSQVSMTESSALIRLANPKPRYSLLS